MTKKANQKNEQEKCKLYLISPPHFELEEFKSELKSAFEALSPGRQRGYLLHFSQPKQAKTRVARIEKHKPNILVGKGLNDNFKAKK